MLRLLIATNALNALITTISIAISSAHNARCRPNALFVLIKPTVNCVQISTQNTHPTLASKTASVSFINLLNHILALNFKSRDSRITNTTILLKIVI